MEELSKAYEPADVEPRWYKYWLDLGVFKAARGTLPESQRT
jgi:valyl-tRNA synthetase